MARLSRYATPRHPQHVNRFIFLAPFVLALLVIACSGGSGTGRGTGAGPEAGAGDTSSVSPEITRFTASAVTITDGDSVTLTAVFSNGTGLIDNGVGAVTSGVPTTIFLEVSTTFTLTVTNSEGQWVASTVTVSVEPHAITLRVVSPTHQQLVGNDLEITATIESVLDIVSVTGAVEGRSASLNYSSDAVCIRAGCKPGFKGHLSLRNLTPGAYELSVTAEDSRGLTVAKRRTIVLDNKPVLTIIKPLDLSVARPTLPLEAMCSDDRGDCTISVSVEGSAAPPTTAVNVLSKTVDLSAYAGRQITLLLDASDSSNQSSRTTRTVFVETSNHLTTVADLVGRIADFDGRQALEIMSGTNGDTLAIYDIVSKRSTGVEVPTGLVISPSNSFLTPTGVLYSAQKKGGSISTARIYDWNNSLLDDLGAPNSNVSLVVAGDFAIWSVGKKLWLRQLSSRTNTEVSAAAGNDRNDVASNGVVAYWSLPAYALMKYEAGGSTTLREDRGYGNIWVKTDGSRYVYSKRQLCDPSCSIWSTAIAYHDGTEETILANFRNTVPQPSPGRDYQINNGWVAFTELGGLGQTQVWSRDPSGALRQRTDFGSNSYIERLSADGEVMLINADKRYLSTTTGQLINVSSSLGTSVKIAGVWYIAIGRSLFEVR